MTLHGRAATPHEVLEHYLPDLVYGANDGLVTTFAIVSGVYGARLSPTVILVLGGASLLADALSMAASNYLSIRSRNDGEAVPPRPEALRHGSMTLLGFLAAGLLPLLPFLLPAHAASWRFAVAATLTGLALFAIGAARVLVIPRRWWRAGVEMLVVGAAAATVAYLAGHVIATLTAGTALGN